MSVQTIILTITMSLALVNCSKGGSGGGGGGGEVTTANTTTSGGVSSSGGGGYKTGTTGQLVVDKGSPTATEVNAQQLNLPAGVKPAGPAVNVSDSKNYNAGQIVIAIPYEGEKKSGLWAALTNEMDTSRIVVIYHVKNKNGTYTLGLVSNPELDFSDNLVSFTSRGPGNYQAAYLPEPVTKPIAKTVDTPVLNAEEESALAPIVWSSLTGEVTAARKFKISGAISNADVILKRCVVMIDEDKIYPYDQAIYVSGSLSTEHVITKDAAHNLYGRLECQDNYGRSVTSEWTDKVIVPQAKYATMALSLATGSVAADGFINNAEKNSSDEWLTASFSDEVEVKYTAWLSAPINYTCASSLDYNLSSHPGLNALPGEGVYWVCVKVTSVHSKVSYEHTPQLTKDTIAPSVDAGSDIIAKTVASINATSSGAAAFAWSKDSGSGTINFGSPNAEDTTVDANTDGTYTLRLTVTDLAGNIASDTMQFTRDTIPPTVSFVSSAESDGAVNIADQAAGGNTDLFGITSDGAASVEYSVWVSSVTNCNGASYNSSNKIPKYSDLSGSNPTNKKICARATDAAGNSAYASSAAITWDLAVPTATIGGLNPAGSPTTQNTLYFQVSGTANTYKYHFGDQSTPCPSVGSWSAPTPIATPTTSNALLDGNHRLCVQGFSSTGNVSAYAVHDWSIDNSSPSPGNNGTVVIEDLYFIGGQGYMAYSWDAASDNDGQGTLEYKVYISNSNSLDVNTVTSGTLLTTHTGGTGVIQKTQSTGLTEDGALKYLYVLVTDTLGNKALYTPRSFRVPLDSNKAFIQMSMGGRSACGIDQEGYLYCWGSNHMGRLGLNINDDGLTHHTPQKVGSKRYQKVSVGQHACALDEAGTAYCWGRGSYGQLGNNDTSNQFAPVAVTGGIKFRDISAGSNTTCGVALDGTGYCWGQASSGQLGNGTTTPNKSAPQPVLFESGSTKFISIATGQATCAIDIQHDLYCWGSNANLQIADSGSSFLKAKLMSNVAGAKFKAVATTGTAVCAVTTDGRVLCQGNNAMGELGRLSTDYSNIDTRESVKVSGGSDLTNIDSISAAIGSSTFCAHAVNSDIYCWGLNNGGAMLTNPWTYDKYNYAYNLVMGAKIATHIETSGDGSTCTLDAQGRVHCWGNNADLLAGDASHSGDNPFLGQTQLSLVAPRSVTRFASIATGANHSCGITGQGVAHCWGDRTNGKLGDGGATSGTAYEAVAINAGSERFTQIAVGAQHSCALTQKGEVACWGLNSSGQLGTGDNNSSSTPALVPTERFVQISLGESHSCGVTASGAAKCWGLNNSGQLGDNSIVSRNSPVTAPGTYLSVSAGKEHTCALRDDGQIACWGDNTYYQLAQAVGSLAPSLIDGGDRFIKLAVGANHGCGIRGDGIPLCWGHNDLSQVGHGSSSDIQTPHVVSAAVRNVVTGANHSCVVKDDNALACWGANSLGQLGRNNWIDQSSMGGLAGVSGKYIRSVALGGNSSCAVMTDGASYCWGDDDRGQLGDMLSDAMQKIISRVSEFFVP